MSEYIIDRGQRNFDTQLVNLIIGVMDHVLISMVLLALVLYWLGFWLVSGLFGVTLVAVGLLGLVVAYVSFCRIFADQRGRHHE